MTPWEFGQYVAGWNIGQGAEPEAEELSDEQVLDLLGEPDDAFIDRVMAKTEADVEAKRSPA